MYNMYIHTLLGIHTFHWVGDMNWRVQPLSHLLVLFHMNAGICWEVKSAPGCKPDAGSGVKLLPGWCWRCGWRCEYHLFSFPVPRLYTERCWWPKSHYHNCTGYQENIIKLGQNQTEPQQQRLWTFVVFMWNNKVVLELQCQIFFPRHTLSPLSHSL